MSTRACFGFEAASGTTDDARIRDITQALPPRWLDRLFEARRRWRQRASCGGGSKDASSPASKLPGTRCCASYKAAGPH